MSTNEMKPSNGDRYGNWPTTAQELLIRAAVLEGSESVDAWRDWIASTEFDDIEYESFRMLGLIYHNLVKHGASEPNLPRMKGIFRRTWYKNQVLLNTLTDVVQLFRANDVDLLVIKGAPISVLYYANMGTRQMYDLDILVKPENARRSIDLLQANGWDLLVPNALNCSKKCLDVRYATHLKNGDGIELDLHWYAIKSCRYRSADSEFWDRSIPVQISDVEARTLDATGHLLHMCVHGLASHNTSALRWVTDAMIILNSAEMIDWSYLEREISQRKLSRQMNDALCYLVERFRPPIPDSFLERLGKNVVHRREDWELWASTRTQERSTAAIVALWSIYARRAEGDGGSVSTIGFVRFLKCMWEVDASWELPITAIRKLLRRAALSISVRRAGYTTN